MLCPQLWGAQLLLAADAEETEEEKLSRLLEEEAARLAAGDAVSPEVWDEWLQWERFRERCQWLPQRLSLADPTGDSFCHVQKRRANVPLRNGILWLGLAWQKGHVNLL